MAWAGPSNIKSAGIDAGQNFLSGQMTSVFAAPSDSIGKVIDTADDIQNMAMSTVSSVSSGATTMMSTAAAAGGKVVGTVIAAGANATGDVSQMVGIAQEAVNAMISYAQDLVSEKVMSLLTPPVNDIMSKVGERTSYWTNEGIKDQAKRVFTPAEKADEESEQKNFTADIAQFTEVLTDNIGKVKEKVDSFCNDITRDVEELSTWMLQGPEWVGKQVEIIENGYEEKVGKFINEQAAKIKEKRDNFIFTIADYMGHNLAGPIVKQSKTLLMKSMNAINEAKQKVINWAKTLIHKAILWIKALIGI